MVAPALSPDRVRDGRGYPSLDRGSSSPVALEQTLSPVDRNQKCPSREAGHPVLPDGLHRSWRWPIFRTGSPRQYRQRYDVSLPCSEWERVGPPRSNHQETYYRVPDRSMASDSSH